MRRQSAVEPVTESGPLDGAQTAADADAGDPQAGLPDPNASPCVDCGHVWFDGERRHEHVVGAPPPGFHKGAGRGRLRALPPPTGAA